MDKAPQILVADNTCEGPSNIVFLLRLSGFDILEFDDELEACNWLLQIDPVLTTRHLLLLNEPKAERSLFALLFQMRQKFKHLELLLVSTEPLQLSGQINDLDPPVHQCRTDQVRSTVLRILKEMDAASDTQQGHQSASINSGPGR